MSASPSPRAGSLSGMPPGAPPPATPPSPSILVLVAHPAIEQSRVNRRMLAAARAAGAHVEVRDLYALYPDYLIDVEAEQAAAAAAQLIVWQHPIHWYGMTPLMKLWLDEVLAFGWAYGEGGAALQGKHLWLAATTGGPEDSYRPDAYNRYFFDAFLPPYEQTAALCGMVFAAPLLLHGAHRADDDEVAAHVAIYAERLRGYPSWPELEGDDACFACDVPADARPADDAPTPVAHPAAVAVTAAPAGAAAASPLPSPSPQREAA